MLKIYLATFMQCLLQPVAILYAIVFVAFVILNIRIGKRSTWRKWSLLISAEAVFISLAAVHVNLYFRDMQSGYGGDFDVLPIDLVMESILPLCGILAAYSLLSLLNAVCAKGKATCCRE